MTVGTVGLWLLVAVAAIAGVTSWLRPQEEPAPASGPDPTDVAADTTTVAAFGELFVESFLTTDEPEDLSGFLGYAPSLDTERGPPVDATAVAAEHIGADTWSVTVRSDESEFWRVGISTTEHGGFVALGLPAPTAGPPQPDRPDIAVRFTEIPTGDPLVDTAEGFIAAHACGAESLDRWLAPATNEAALTQPICSTVELDRWGVSADGDSRTVVVEALLEDGPRSLRVTYPLLMVQRDGRWEVAELLPAPPTTTDQGGNDRD